MFSVNAAPGHLQPGAGPDEGAVADDAPGQRIAKQHGEEAVERGLLGSARCDSVKATSVPQLAFIPPRPPIAWLAAIGRKREHIDLVLALNVDK